MGPENKCQGYADRWTEGQQCQKYSEGLGMTSMAAEQQGDLQTLPVC